MPVVRFALPLLLVALGAAVGCSSSPGVGAHAGLAGDAGDAGTSDARHLDAQGHEGGRSDARVTDARLTSDGSAVDAKLRDAGVDGESGSLAVTTKTLPSAVVGVAYASTVAASGGTPPYSWDIQAGALPGGLTIGAASGKVAGTPSTAGIFVFNVAVKDSSATPETASSDLAIFVAAAGAGTPVTACGTLGTTGATYVLQGDVTAPGTCFSVTADGVTLDLDGHKVTYGSASQGSQLVAGIMMVQCWETGWTNGSIGTASGSACGTFQGFAVHDGTIEAGGGALQPGSHVIRAGGSGSLTSGPTIFGVTSTWSAGFSQFLATDYGNVVVAGGAVVYGNVLTNDTSAPCAAVGCRDQLQGTSIFIGNAIATKTPALLFANHVAGGPQGAIACDAPGCIVHDNVLDPGNPALAYANDFALYCWSSCNYYDNTILTPLSASGGSRGVELGGIVTTTVGANVHDNTITTLVKPNDAEYSGCEGGGAYGIQFDDNGSGAVADNNDVTAVSDQCWATGLRLTDTETQTNVSKGNTYTAIRKSSTSPACTYIAGAPGAGCAHAVSIDGPTGFLSEHDRFSGDSDILFFDWDGASGVTLASPTFMKGTTNPSQGFHTFVFRNGGTPVADIHVQDATFGPGTGPTDTDLPARGGNNQAVSLYIDWSQTVTVENASGVVSGATVTFTDTLGSAYSATTNAAGVASIVVPEYRLNNDTTANSIETHNPYSRSVTASGCTSATVSNLTVSGTDAVIVTLSGC